ncbi:hypothetical protein ACOME3_007904 [Neoechinorhynchus agilis]
MLDTDEMARRRVFDFSIDGNTCSMQRDTTTLVLMIRGVASQLVFLDYCRTKSRDYLLAAFKVPTSSLDLVVRTLLHRVKRIVIQIFPGRVTISGPSIDTPISTSNISQPIINLPSGILRANDGSEDVQMIEIVHDDLSFKLLNLIDNAIRTSTADFEKYRSDINHSLQGPVMNRRKDEVFEKALFDAIEAYSMVKIRIEQLDLIHEGALALVNMDGIYQIDLQLESLHSTAVDIGTTFIAYLSRAIEEPKGGFVQIKEKKIRNRSNQTLNFASSRSREYNGYVPRDVDAFVRKMEDAT